MNTIGFIYKTTNLVNGKIYIGQHIGKVNDSYLGSGVVLHNAIRKYGRCNFKREILRLCYTEHELTIWEHVYIIKFRSFDKSIGYNIAKGDVNSSGFNPAKLPEVREKIRKSAIGRKMSDEQKSKVSARFKGISLSSDRKTELSTIANGRKSITNGKMNKWLHNGEDMPDGWYYGRLPYKVKRKKREDRINHNTSLGLIWVTNGVNNLYIKKGSDIPQGYYKGFTKKKKI